MPEVTRAHALETVLALAILGGGLVLAWLFLALLARLIHVAMRSRQPERDRRLSRALRLPLALLIVGAAVLIAIRTLSYAEPHRAAVERVWAAATLSLLVLLAQRLTSALLFRRGDGASGGAAPLGPVTPLARRAVNVAILAVGALLVLDQLGIAISPLLAGLGIGGLAVALALQPLLTNLFAGSYIMSDSSIRERDYITVLGGPSGYVIDIGWRATRLRAVDGGLVIVPNGTLASSIVTNHGPGRSELVSVSYPIPYGHSLERVEQVAGEALRAVVDQNEEAVKDSPLLVRFRHLGETRIECVLSVRARSRSDVSDLEHALVKSVHDRFQAEGFNGPVRSE